MNKNSKITDITGDGTWDTPDGKTLYKFKIITEAGDSGTIFKQSQDSGLAIGQDLEYYVDPKGNLKIPKKPYNPQAGGGSKMSKEDWKEKDKKTSDNIARAVALKEAVSFHVSEGGDIKKVLNNAEIFFDWLKGKSNQLNDKNSNDLPF